MDADLLVGPRATDGETSAAAHTASAGRMYETDHGFEQELPFFSNYFSSISASTRPTLPAGRFDVQKSSQSRRDVIHRNVSRGSGPREFRAPRKITGT